MDKDCIKSYLGLREAGYNHEYVKHSEGEWVRGECHINNCENRASILRPWIAVHRVICKNNPTLYPAAFKTYNRLRKMKPNTNNKNNLHSSHKNPSKDRIR